jgi:hypothetical protein
VNSQDSGDTFGSPLRLLGLRWRRDDEGGANTARHLADEGARARRERDAAGGADVLMTFSFQAPAFYEVRGFEVVAIIDNHPRSHQNLLMRKRLRSVS